MKQLFADIPRIEGERVTLRQLVDTDAPELEELASNDNIYRYEPGCLFERQYDDMHEMLRDLYGEHFLAKESLILGIELNGEDNICGLVEFYDYREDLHAVSVGYRLLERYWGRGIATDTLRLVVDYLVNETDIDTIAAQTMSENTASAHVLEKVGFVHTAHDVEDDWDRAEPTIVNKWFY